MYGRSSALDLCENQRLKVCVVGGGGGGGGGVESSFSEKLLSSKQAFQKSQHGCVILVTRAFVQILTIKALVKMPPAISRLM